MLYAPVLILGVIFVSILLLTKIISDNHLRNKLIEKGMVDENLKYLYGNRYDSGVPSALKWGIVLTGIGIAFLVGHLVPEELKESITISAMFLLAGLGLIIYYLISKRLSHQAENKD